MASLCKCGVGLTVAAEVNITMVSKKKSFNINLDNILKNITSSKLCKPLCKKQNVSEKKCKVNTEPVKSCSEYEHWWDGIQLSICETEKGAEELYNDAKHLVCDVVEVSKYIENAGCAVLDGVQDVACDIVLDIENDFQLIVSGTWYSFEEGKISTSDAAVGGGIALHIETIQLNEIMITNPLGNNPIFIDCAVVFGGDGIGPNCAICQHFPDTTINENDGILDFSMGNITWSVCITVTGLVLNFSGNANVQASMDESIGFAGLVSFGIDIPVF